MTASKNTVGNMTNTGPNSTMVGNVDGDFNQSNINQFKVDSKYKDELPGLYSRALEDFEKRVNEYLKQFQVTRTPATEVNNEIKDLQKSTNELAEQVKTVSVDNVKDEKKKNLLGILKNIGTKLKEFLPEGISIGLAMTPLAPFATLAGKTIGELVNDGN